MTWAMPSVLFVSVITLMTPTTLRAQDATRDKPPEQAKQEEERPTGLPSRVKWTFNFDAGWGSFGFANSLFTNPKEPGVDENLSDQWFEGYAKPAISATYTLASSSEIYGKLSAVGERTYGSVPAAFGEDVSSFGPEDLSIGWRSGKSLTMGENALDFVIGRTQYQPRSRAFCSGTVRPREAPGAGTGPTRARPSSLRPSAAFSRDRIRSRPSTSTRTSSRRATAAAVCGAPTTSTASARTRRSAPPT